MYGSLRRVRIVLDYRPALRARTGVGERVHELARALAADRLRESDGRGTGGAPDELVLFTSSWKDRPAAGLTQAIPGARIVDRRIPVRGLTWAWNRLGWPPIEMLAGACDIVHAQTPLLVPARHAAQVVTVHDLDFLHHPERGEAEMRRDFPALAAKHASMADHVVVPSRYTAGEVEHHLNIAPERITVCAPGPPAWATGVAERRGRGATGTHILFIGTLEPRKNVGTLIEAYRRLRTGRPDAPPLVIAGGMTDQGRRWQREASEAGLGESVVFRGYVDDALRPALFADARIVVLPSLDEGFGFPVLEAMASRVPVVISNRGSLPEVAGDASEAVDPTDAAGLCARMEALLDDARAEAAAARGLVQAARYSWVACAYATRTAYRSAMAVRRTR